MERDNLMHGARTALNQKSGNARLVRKFLKTREREAKPEMSDEEFEKHWRYHRPEIMHAGAAEAVQAWKSERVKE